ncbi:MAG: hypothetical protein JW963_12855 [Anaerolineales bacterium]|nr:hypothetical protein [Anaerolineales bacterium]
MVRKVKDRNKQQDSVGGDQNIIQGNVSGGIVVQGRNAKVNVQQQSGIQINELTALFERLYETVHNRPEDPNVDKEEINETIQKIQAESEKQEQANRSKLERWVGYLNNLAPDIVDVILASLGGPVTGFVAVLKNIARQARKQAGGEAPT